MVITWPHSRSIKRCASLCIVGLLAYSIQETTRALAEANAKIQTSEDLSDKLAQQAEEIQYYCDMIETLQQKKPRFGEADPRDAELEELRASASGMPGCAKPRRQSSCHLPDGVLHILMSLTEQTEKIIELSVQAESFEADRQQHAEVSQQPQACFLSS